jgi:hypothetical protein
MWQGQEQVGLRRRAHIAAKIHGGTISQVEKKDMLPDGTMGVKHLQVLGCFVCLFSVMMLFVVCS